MTRLTILLLCLSCFFVYKPAYSASNSPQNSFFNCSENDCSKQLNELKKLARRGSPEANYILATLYLYGESVEKNERKAISLYKRAAEAKLSEANFMISQIYNKGLGVTKNPRKANRYLRKAIAGGSTSAIYQKAVLTLRNEHMSEEDTKEAVESLEEIAARKHVEASYLLGEIYLNGFKSIKADKTKGVEYLGQSAKYGYRRARDKMAEVGIVPKATAAATGDEDIETINVSAAPQNLSEFLNSYAEMINSQKIYDDRSIFNIGKACEGNNGCQVASGDVFFLNGLVDTPLEAAISADAQQ